MTSAENPSTEQPLRISSNNNNALAGELNVEVPTANQRQTECDRKCDPLSNNNRAEDLAGNCNTSGAGLEAQIPPERNESVINLIPEHHRGNLDLEYIEDYPIRRFHRKWRRAEVQGMCCLSIQIICLACLAILSLYALGYMEDNPHHGDVPYSFSARVLQEFFTYEETAKEIKQCYFAPQSFSLEEEDPVMSVITSDIEFNEVDGDVIVHGGRLFPKVQCRFKGGHYAIDWLLRLCSANFLSVLTAFTSGFYFLSISVRRRRGIQMLLILPSFLTFFISIFQQIPITFQYSYTSYILTTDIRASMAICANTHFKHVPLLDQTQKNMQCCGFEAPSSYKSYTHTNGSYPGSCCNTTAFDCSGMKFIPPEQSWSEGCYKKEHDRVQRFEKWALMLLAVKIIVEVAIFCTMSELTRFDYPPPETVENSRCNFRDYQIKCRGTVRIKGITKDGKLVAETKYFLPWRLLPSRLDLLSGATLHLNTDINRTKGSVEITRRVNAENFRNEDIYIDLNRRNSGLYIFTLS